MTLKRKPRVSYPSFLCSTFILISCFYVYVCAIYFLFCFSEIAQKEGGVKDKDGIAPTLEFMKEYFPEIIGYPEANADDYPTKTLSPFINIDLDVQGSWLQKPLPESNSSDKVGILSSN